VNTELQTIPTRRRWPALAVFLPALLVAGCSGLRLEDFAAATPLFDPYVFFNGRVHAWGVVQDWRGRVARRFDVTIVGREEGGTLILDESFVYADGERDTRVWRIVRTGPGTYDGTAGDIIGTARGRTAGNAMNWAYAMDLAVSGKTYRVQFDDWMWQLDDRALMNRSYIRKFGLTVAEVTIFMRREDS
jgi:hypothetical protein